MLITKQFLDDNPNAIFVFGDNLLRKGTGGAAALRYHKQTYGFITKKYPSNYDNSFFTPEEYTPIFQDEMRKLRMTVKDNSTFIFYISKLGSMLANKYQIFEKVIEPNIKLQLADCPNVRFLW